MSEKKFYITTPIYYPNSRPHIGSLYTTVACDMIARFKRLDGYAVKFLTGTDEHGQKIEKAAVAAQKTPLEFVDALCESFKELLRIYGLSNDDFIRTTETRHKKGVEVLWKTLEEKGHIYLGSYAGWYAVADEAFYLESDLVEGKAPTGAQVEWVEEPSYFFNLSAWQEPLLRFYEENPDFIQPTSRRNEVLSFVKSGLKDLSVSRTSFSWGIPVPSNPQHVIYVWLDALTNYITALGYPDTGSPDYQKYWPADVHMIGKDIVKFHAVYWPAFLMAAGLPTPKRVFAHGWWTNRGDKISKSLGNVVDPFDLAQRFGTDQVRYFLLREVPFGGDGEFSEEALSLRINSQLSNELGNLAQRVLSMIAKNLPNGFSAQAEGMGSMEEELLKEAYALPDELRLHIDQQALHKYGDAVWKVVASGNKYIDHSKPWALAKERSPDLEKVLYATTELLRCLGIVLQPVVPVGAEKLLDQLGVPQSKRGLAQLVWSERRPFDQLHIKSPTPIFPRV